MKCCLALISGNIIDCQKELCPLFNVEGKTCLIRDYLCLPLWNYGRELNYENESLKNKSDKEII